MNRLQKRNEGIVHMIRKATPEDLSAIKRIADTNKATLSFVMRSTLQAAIARQWLLVAEQDERIVGFCNYWYRKDGIITIYEICVKEQYRGKGIGRELIEAVKQEQPSFIRLKAIVGIPANSFYQHMSFALVRVESGRKRSLNVWELAVGQPHLLCRG